MGLLLLRFTCSTNLNVRICGPTVGAFLGECLVPAQPFSAAVGAASGRPPRAAQSVWHWLSQRQHASQAIAPSSRRRRPPSRTARRSEQPTAAVLAPDRSLALPLRVAGASPASSHSGSKPPPALDQTLRRERGRARRRRCSPQQRCCLALQDERAARAAPFGPSSTSSPRAPQLSRAVNAPRKKSPPTSRRKEEVRRRARDGR